MNREALEKMLAQGNDSSLLRYTLGTICLKEGLVAEAAEHLQQALSHDPKHSASWKSYGKALMKLERIEEAIEAYQSGISIAKERGDIQAIKEMEVFLNRLKKQKNPD